MHLPLRLVCVHPFHGFTRGQEVTDPAEIKRLIHADNREHHFVKTGGWQNHEESPPPVLEAPREAVATED